LTPILSSLTGPATAQHGDFADVTAKISCWSIGKLYFFSLDILL
jgi:hypothetical protein